LGPPVRVGWHHHATPTDGIGDTTMSEYYDGGADAGHEATYQGHDAYQGEEHGQYADVQEQVHHVIELIGEKIDGIEHDVHEAYDEPKADDHAGEDDKAAYASDEYKADDHKADDHKTDEYQSHSPYARS
jgi:hypothetical protein